MSITAPGINDSLPADFDASYYREYNPDLREFSDEQLRQHYLTYGIGEGRSPSPYAMRKEFFSLVNPYLSVLEIGPFANPSVKGRNVKYFDVLADEELKKRAVQHKLDPANCPPISFVSPTGDLGVVDQEFDVVVSSHCIEHQPDLIAHLLKVSRILKTGGHYFLAIPDKRYCFDHFIPESDLADILSAHVNAEQTHSLDNVIEHVAMTTHNDAPRHWRGDHGTPSHRSNPAMLRGAIAMHSQANGKYIDVHAWQFTPDSFTDIMSCLFETEAIPLRLIRRFPTMRGQLEFFVILEKTAKDATSLVPEIPEGFDPELYLQANPDVREIGTDPLVHYVAYGRDEKRKLRP